MTSPPRPRPAVITVLAAIVVLGLAGCGSASGGRTAPVRLGAAEPSVAPTETTAPRGRTVDVGSAPEGIVYDPVTKLLAVGVRNPDRLVLIDAATMTVVRTVPLAGHVRHLQLAAPGGPVIVPEEDANALELVTLPGGASTSFPVGTSPHDATAVTGGYVAGDEFGKSFTIVTGDTPRTYKVLDQPGGMVGYGDTFAVVDVGDYTVSTWKVSDGSRIAQLPAGAGPTHGVRVGADGLVVTDTRGQALITYQVSPLKQIASVPLAGGPYGITVDAQNQVVWVTLTASNQVVAFDVSSGTPRELERLTTVAQPDTVAAYGRDVWVTGTRDGVVEHLTRLT